MRSLSFILLINTFSIVMAVGSSSGRIHQFYLICHCRFYNANAEAKAHSNFHILINLLMLRCDAMGCHAMVDVDVEVFIKSDTLTHISSFVLILTNDGGNISY